MSLQDRATETSREANEQLEQSGDKLRQRMKVLRLLRQHGPCTARELAEASGQPISIQKRLPELVKDGAAERVGERRCGVTGKTVTVWAVVGGVSSNNGRTPDRCARTAGDAGSNPAAPTTLQVAARDPVRGTLYRGGAKVGLCGCGTVNWGPCNRDKSCGQEHCTAPGHACPEVLQ